MYNRLINAPTSIVSHDDLEMYERAQGGLMSDGLEWVNVEGLYEDSEDFDEARMIDEDRFEEWLGLWAAK